MVPLFAATALLEQTCLALGGERLRARINAIALALLVATALVLVPGRTVRRSRWWSLTAPALGSYGFAYRRELPWGLLAQRSRAPLLLNAALAAMWIAARMLGAPAMPSLAAAAVAYTAAVLAFGMLPREGGMSAATTALASLAVLPALPARPFVSVVMAVRNEARGIEAALDAVRAQDWPDEPASRSSSPTDTRATRPARSSAASRARTRVCGCWTTRTAGWRRGSTRRWPARAAR